MNKYLLVGVTVTVGVLFGTGIGGIAAPPVVWSERNGNQLLMQNRFRFSGPNKSQNDPRKIVEFFGVVGLEGTPGNFDDCNLKVRWNRRKIRVQVFEDGGYVNITSEVKRGAYEFNLEENMDIDGYDGGTHFFFRVRKGGKGRKAILRSPIHLISKRLSGGDAGRHRVTIITD